ncbi:hypothetical protein R1sor_019542 [Riccia sorocarpa]|uniref:Uncharacterized protein n=1 Tax=Riccia sorocarpa TaxID=122646 RepID=A0ABD3ICT5_9MARC
MTGHRRDGAYRPLIYRPENFEKDAVEVRPVITTETKLFKGLNYENFNQYLRKHYVIPGADPLTSRLKVKQNAEPGVNSGTASPKGSAKADAPSPETPATASPDLSGIEKLKADGHEKTTPLEIAVQLVGQVQSSAYFIRPEHFMIRVAEETARLFKRLLGQDVGDSKQWKAFQASPKANNDVQFIVNVYVDLTNAVCTFLENEGLRVVGYPDYVHMVME